MIVQIHHIKKNMFSYKNKRTLKEARFVISYFKSGKIFENFFKITIYILSFIRPVMRGNKSTSSFELGPKKLSVCHKLKFPCILQPDDVNL